MYITYKRRAHEKVSERYHSEVRLYITAKEPRLSLHTPDDDIVNVVQKKVLYQGPLELFSARTN